MCHLPGEKHRTTERCSPTKWGVGEGEGVGRACGPSGINVKGVVGIYCPGVWDRALDLRQRFGNLP